MTVKLPAGSRVEAKAASAELRAVGRLGDVAFQRRVNEGIAELDIHATTPTATSPPAASEEHHHDERQHFLGQFEVDRHGAG